MKKRVKRELTQAQLEVRQTRSRHALVIAMIVLSYFFTYFMPIILLYFTLRDSFVTVYITGSHLSLSFLGFVTVSSILFIVLLIKLSIKLRSLKASILKQAVSGLMHVGITLFFVFVLIKLYNFTFAIEADTINFITKFRSFVATSKNYLIVFAGCLTISSLFNIVAIILDKEYVRSIEWL